MNNKNTEDILNSLDGMKRAKAPEFFYPRLKARMEKAQENPATSRWWVLKPVYAVAVIALVIVVNLAVVLLKSETQNSGAIAGDTDSYQTIAADYNLADNSSFYELNQENK